jgi:hypothetical protein
VVRGGRGLVVELTADASGPRPVQAAPFLFDRGDWGSLGAALDDVVRDRGWRSRRVSLAIGGDVVRHKMVEMPWVPRRQMDRLLSHEAALLAGDTEDAAPITGYTWGRHCYPSSGGAQHVLLALVERQLVDAVSTAVGDAGLVLERATTIEIAGLQRLLVHDALPDGLVAHVAVDEEETSFTAFDNGRLVFNRVLLRGFRSMSLPSGEVASPDRSTLERLAQELQRSALYVKRETRRPVELMIIGGIPRAGQAARETLAACLHIPIAWESLPPEGLQADGTAETLYLAAIGATVPRSFAVNVDLLPSHSFDERHPWVGWGAVAAGLVIWAAAGAWGGVEIAALRSEIAARATQVDHLEESCRPTSQSIDTAYRDLCDRRAEIERYLQAAARCHDSLSPGAVMAIVSDGLPADAVFLDCLLERVGRAWRCALSGAVIADSRTAADATYRRLLAHLVDSPYVTVGVKGWERVPPSTGRTGRLELVRDGNNRSVYPFELTCRLALPGEGW